MHLRPASPFRTLRRTPIPSFFLALTNPALESSTDICHGPVCTAMRAASRPSLPTELDLTSPSSPRKRP
ncbi:hypothetical protein Landi51_13712 [Colletotrichum acutatum]